MAGIGMAIEKRLEELLMKTWMKLLVVLGAVGLVGLAGCKWEMFEDDDSWDSSVSWANFSGTYRSSSGVSVTVSNGVVVPSSGGLAEVKGETVGVGNGVNKTFSGTLAGKPVYPGSLTITDGTESFEDSSESGILEGDKGGTGAINYNTGVFSVTFLLQPNPGTEIEATYIYYVGGDDDEIPDDDDGGETTKTIKRFTVVQDGNVLSFTDEDGDVYNGKMGKLATTAGDESGKTSGTIVGNFEVQGDNGIRIVGTFEGTYTSPNTEQAETYGTLINRYLRGTWINASGQTGNIDFSATGD